MEKIIQFLFLGVQSANLIWVFTLMYKISDIGTMYLGIGTCAYCMYCTLVQLSRAFN